MLKTLFKSRSDKAAGARLCAAIGVRAREPVFFSQFGVADTIDGRFDLVVLHSWLVLDRLREAGMKDVSQGLVDSLFVSFDESLRDLGVGDIGVGHRMKKMADAFYGRLAAYSETKDGASMADAITRNLYRGKAGHEKQAAALAQYVTAARQRIGTSDLANGAADFGTLPVQ